MKIATCSVLVGCLATVLAQEAATNVDRMAAFTSPDFVLNLQDAVKTGVVDKNDAGSLGKMNIKTLPTLKGQKLSMTLIDLEPWQVAVILIFMTSAMNPPHIHPRAGESIYVIKGGNITMGFIEENGAKLVLNQLQQSDATFFPQGSIHFQFNDACEPAQLMAALNNEDPGVLTVAPNVLKFPPEVVQSAFGASMDAFQSFTNQPPPKGPLVLVEACRAKCGLIKKPDTPMEKSYHSPQAPVPPPQQQPYTSPSQPLYNNPRPRLNYVAGGYPYYSPPPPQVYYNPPSNGYYYRKSK